jgi:hypothetical protein
VAAPNYVPTEPEAVVRSYRSPDRVPGAWTADRPGELGPAQPRASGLGSPGPDLGYVLTLVDRFDRQVRLAPGERRSDCDAGCAAVAMKRASLFGRAPVITDLEVGYRVWGFLDPAPADLVEVRGVLFERIDHPHHHRECRRVVDAVPEDTLRVTPAQVAEAHRRDWRSLLDLDPD